MVFSSLQFVFIFIPVFFGCYYLLPGQIKNIILLIGSLIFYFVGTIGHPEHYLLFLCCMVFDFLAGLWMERDPAHKKLFLTAGILFHLANLFLFKYSGFVAEELEKFIPSLPAFTEPVLPIGISFYTFQGISYMADVYRGKIRAEKKLLRYTVYISMFEQLIAGPIVTYSEVRRELYHRNINVSLLAGGFRIFVFGLGMKVLLANPISKLWSQTCAIGFESISTPLAWMAIGAFSFHIYFDFFGYSLMAIGLGKMLGFKLPQNFSHPYVSLSMTEFWRRWHMTLGSWFREYVYIPLGGNRKGTAITIRNLFIVWVLTGVWHGAGYNFLLWGLVLFFILVTEKYFTGAFLNRNPLIGHSYMILLIPLTWTIFAIEDMGQMGIFFTKLFPFLGNETAPPFPRDYIKYFLLYYPFFIAGILFSTRLPYRLLRYLKRKTMVINLITLILLAASTYCMYRGFDDPFLYFRF
jgi:alginate O-acetyltransferase complex protein AlgI